MKTYEEPETATSSDTEITLGTRSILGIFFALALICGVFFGFGYSLGRGGAAKSSLAAQTAAQAAGQNPISAAAPIKTVVESSSDAKPLAGAPLATPPTLAASPSTAPAAATPALPQATGASYSASAPQSVRPATYPAQPSTAQAPTSQPIMVQIAAVSRREDANALVSALSKLGYSASIHAGPPDSLLRVQIGPFATRDAAKAVRAKLLNDGYNAILK